MKDKILIETTQYLQKFYPNADEQYIYDGLKYYSSIYRSELKNNTDPLTIAASFQQLVDKTINESKEKDSNNFKKVKCKKSCSSCCNIAVCISHEEAILYSKIIETQKISIDHKKLKIQSQYNTANWYQLKPQYRSCIFLKNNQCQIYKYRPISCRVHFVADNPKYCNVLKYNKKPITIWRPIESELIVMTMTLLGRANYMPIKLLEVF